MSNMGENTIFGVPLSLISALCEQLRIVAAKGGGWRAFVGAAAEGAGEELIGIYVVSGPILPAVNRAFLASPGENASGQWHIPPDDVPVAVRDAIRLLEGS